MFLCEDFWKSEAEDQALTLMQEAMHTFSGSIQDDVKRGFQVTACYERFVLVASGSHADGRPNKQGIFVCAHFFLLLLIVPSEPAVDEKCCSGGVVGFRTREERGHGGYIFGFAEPLQRNISEQGVELGGVV